MISQKQIQEVAARLGEAARAKQVILFGSHARGESESNSDVDFLIIAESNLPRFKRSRALYKMFRPYPFAMDLLVYTPEEVEKSRRTPLSFISTVLKEGKTLYERGE
ncbi:MAG: nucleotidyltransferase domain-containing protein [Planctomycetota bacterium]|nr:nucleotidyltransferase domain-containing protein [Planctomycetota bacterium]MDA1138584.1 nucleotidyltransferase domain-containing protein [Planctomycetota bacterium]